ncbi:MAG: phosphoserine phosphatase SerB [Epsilonproteobacteria bacterium]|jgi:phosphoserine phosphatase|nr:phosphoserine phosphatase SerB [Campylobacterota bacterium]
MKLAVFDFDSTLMDGETIDFLAEPLGLKERVASITKEAMEGKLDFFEALTTRVALLKGLKKAQVEEICRNLPIMRGAEETILALKKRGYRVVCFSGGFRSATSPICRDLGIDADFSNILHDVDGILSGKVGGDMMFDYSKGDMLLRLQNLLGVSKDDTVAIGDGANDLSMFKYASTKIAFCAKPILKEASTDTIDRKDLREVLDIVK